MDNLVDRLAICDKERKRNKEQITQVNSVLCQHRKESKENITKIISDVENCEQKFAALCEDTLPSINSRMEQIAQENHKCDQMFSSMKEELTKIHQLMRSLDQEISSLKENFNSCMEGKSEQLKSNGNQCQDQMILARMIQEMRTENREFFESIIPLIKCTNKTDTQKGKSSEGSSDINKSGNNRSRQSQTDGVLLQTVEKTSQNSTAKSHLNAQSNTKTQNNTLNTPTSSQAQGKPDSSKGKSRGNSQSQQETKPRDTYRRDTNTINRKVDGSVNKRSESGRKPSCSDSLSANSDDTWPKNVTIDGSCRQEEPKNKREKYTRKCMVIHDPYFKEFDKNKFSRWYDITTRQYETLLKTKKDPTLLADIQKLGPAVVFLHIGQADLLNRTPGNTVVEDMTWLIKEILSKTSAKLCVSLMIPLASIPQIKSIIRQVNREISNSITVLRSTEMGSSRVFTQNNDALGDYITQTTGSNGTVVSLNNRGQRKLWLHLKNGLSRALDLHTHQNSRIVSSIRPDHSQTETPGSRSNNG